MGHKVADNALLNNSPRLGQTTICARLQMSKRRSAPYGKEKKVWKGFDPKQKRARVFEEVKALLNSCRNCGLGGRGRVGKPLRRFFYGGRGTPSPPNPLTPLIRDVTPLNPPRGGNQIKTLSVSIFKWFTALCSLFECARAVTI